MLLLMMPWVCFLAWWSRWWEEEEVVVVSILSLSIVEVRGDRLPTAPY